MTIECDTAAAAAHVDGLAYSQDLEPAASDTPTPIGDSPSVQPWSAVLLRAAGLVGAGLASLGVAALLPHDVIRTEVTASQTTSSAPTVDAPAPPLVVVPNVVPMADEFTVYQQIYRQRIDGWDITDPQQVIKSAHDLCEYMDNHPNDPLGAGAALLRQEYPKVTAHDSEGFAVAAARAYCRENDKENVK